jgi:CheY-like chemotaxis protein/two-component sensor histidine kinase
MMEQLPAADPVQADMRRTIERQSRHLMRIVDDMLDIARITRGTLAIDQMNVDLAEVVARAVEVATAGGRRHALSVDLPPAPFVISGDPGRLTQVVGNLLNNATRYTPEGGSIWLKGWREGDHAVLTVRDNGRGIPTENLESIFGMFVQGKEPLHRVGGGLGVGLALARRIAELHRGSLTAKSEGAGKGSEFTLRLPVGSPPPAVTRTVKPTVTAADKAASKRVLIVDDNLDAASTLDELMRSLGHLTMVARDGAQALACVEEFKPDVVLLDIGMPGMSGYEVARGLRARNPAPMKIVAVTGWGSETDRGRSAEAGFDLHLVKPVDELELLRILKDGGENGGSSSIH